MTTTLPNPLSESEVKDLVQSIEQGRESKRGTVDQWYFLERLRAALATLISEIVGEEISSHEVTLAAVPPNHDGDFALQVPLLMRDMPRYRGEILPKINNRIFDLSDFKISYAALVGPFLNFSLSTSSLVATTLHEIEQLGPRYGCTNAQSGKRIIIEYSSPNMGKSLHVGHLGTTLVGQGMANIFEAAGATVFRISHLGDWGTPCGMLEVGCSMYEKYESLDIDFDAFLGEAFYEPYLHHTIQMLREAGIAEQDGEAVVAKLEEGGLGTVLLQKSDGATTYFARDVVALFKRKELFDYDLALYVVGSEQTLHFRQLFAVAQRMGYLKGAECAHLPIGLITRNGSKISSRAGGALGAEELRDAIYTRALSQVTEALGYLEQDQQSLIAKQLTNGALFYNQLLASPGKSTDFNLSKILDMKGKSGAYLQYACVRGKGILRKVGYPQLLLEEIDQQVFATIDPSALNMVKLALLLPDIVNQSCDARSPHPLAHYLHLVGQAINHFYQQVKIKDLESPMKDLYLHVLIQTVRALENGLGFLNIQVPDRM